MSLAAGTRLGAYEVVGGLGVGGMGEVYRARDTRLNRIVALKVLPAAFAGDADRLARFTREAQVLASLNHPHIAAIYGVEESEGVRALVMELVEGRDLSDLIDTQWKAAARGLDLHDVLAIARQIAEALDAAHSRGIVHRDLKPANVKVRDDDTVKVLDFGLAKAAEPTPAAGAGAAPTMTSPAMTQMGVILGTAAYMSPEQARGKAVDKRADIWAFGCVLYEMLTGRLPFDGETMTDVLGAIVRAEPDWGRLPADTPVRVRTLLARCLQKDPARRLRDIGDAIDELVEAPAPMAGAAPAAIPVATPATTPRATATSRVRTALPWALAAAGVILTGAAWLRGAPDATERRPRYLHVDKGPDLMSPAISPDGTTVAYVRGGRIAVRRLDQPEAITLEGTDDAANLSWTEDSRSIVFVTSSMPVRVRIVPVSGGASRLVAGDFTLPGDAQSRQAFAPSGLTVCRGEVIFSIRSHGGLAAVAEGQSPRLLVPLPAGASRWSNPSCLSDGRLLAVLVSVTSSKLVVIDGEAQSTVYEAPDALSFPQHVPGAIVMQRGSDSTYSANAGVWALPVTDSLSAAAGQPRLLVADARNPTVSSDGTLVVRTGLRRLQRQLVWTTRDGVRLGVSGRPQQRFREPAISPDGTRVAVAALGYRGVTLAGRIWLHVGETSREWLPSERAQGGPAWSPDGRRLAYWEGDRLMVREVDGADEPRMLMRATWRERDARVTSEWLIGGGGIAWTPDGRQLLFSAPQGTTVPTMPTMRVAIDGDAPPTVLLPDGRSAVVSPDGTLLAYVAFTLDRDEVFVTTYPTPGRVWQVSVGGGRRPRWNPKGGELFFTGGPNVGTDPNSHRDLFVASVTSNAGVSVGTPVRLFDATAMGLELTTTEFRAYDVAPDGQRLLVQTSGLAGTPAVTVVDSLPALLRAGPQP